jgi:hypothetical protein
MGNGPKSRDVQRVARAIANAGYHSHPQECVYAIEAWFHMRDHWEIDGPTPQIGAAIVAGYRWLDVHCPACQQVAALDLHKVDAHPQTPLANITLTSRCSCHPQSPPGRIGDLSKTRPEGAVDRWYRRQREKMGGLEPGEGPSWRKR